MVQPASTSPSPSPPYSSCAAEPALLRVTVVVSATGVQGVTVPATGAGFFQSPVAVITTGFVLTTLAIGGLRLKRRLRKP